MAHQSSQLTIFQTGDSHNAVYQKKKDLYAEIHPNLCAVHAAHRPYSAFFSIQLQYCTLHVLISFSRLIMVLKMLVLSETVVILVDHNMARDSGVKLRLIQKLGDYARTVMLSYLKLILSTFIERTGTLVRQFLYRYASK